MAQRVTGDEVKEIIATTLTAEQVQPFIVAANLMVDQLTGEGYTAELLKEIERWLAAHFVAVRDPRTSDVALGDASATFEGRTDMGLNFTRYGQQAMMLEVHGKLAQIMTRKRPAEVKTIA